MFYGLFQIMILNHADLFPNEKEEEEQEDFDLDNIDPEELKVRKSLTSYQ